MTNENITTNIVNKCTHFTNILYNIKEDTEKIQIIYRHGRIYIFINNKNIQPDKIYDNTKFKSGFKYFYQEKCEKECHKFNNLKYDFRESTKHSFGRFNNYLFGLIYLNNSETKYINMYCSDDKFIYDKPININKTHNYNLIKDTLINNKLKIYNTILIIPNIFTYCDNIELISNAINYNLSNLFMEEIYFKNLIVESNLLKYANKKGTLITNPCKKILNWCLLPNKFKIPLNSKNPYDHGKHIPETLKREVIRKQIYVSQKLKLCYEISRDDFVLLCPCCQYTDINTNSYRGPPHCGHIKSRYYDGKTCYENLLFVCAECNTDIGTDHMLAWIVKKIDESERLYKIYGEHAEWSVKRYRKIYSDFIKLYNMLGKNYDI